MVSALLRRQIPIVLVWILTILALVNFFTGSLEEGIGALSAYASTVTALIVITSSIAYALRTIHDIMLWSRTPKEKRTKEMYIIENIYSLSLFFILMVIFVLTGATSSQFEWVMTYVVIPSFNAGVAYTACFIAIGIFYHWRIRNFETVLFVVATVMVLIGRAPIFGALFPQLPDTGMWIENYLVSPVARMFTLMTSIGVLTFLLSVIRGKAAGFE